MIRSSVRYFVEIQWTMMITRVLKIIVEESFDVQNDFIILNVL